MRSPPRSTWFLALVSGTLTTILTLCILRAFECAETKRYQETVRATTLQQLSVIRGSAESAINKRVYSTLGLKAYVSQNPDLNSTEFAQVAAHMIEDSPGIRSVTLIRDNIISDVYPRAGNEQALGLNLMQHPVQRRDALKAIATGKGWLSGPTQLVQGGEAFIDRTPVFVQDSSPDTDSRKYWGMVSILIDKQLLVEEIMQHAPANLKFALGHVENSEHRVQYFLGDSTIERQQPLQLSVSLPNGEWQVLGIPRGGWPEQSPKVAAFRNVGLFVCCLLGVLVFLIVRSYYAVRRAQRNAEAALLRLEERDELLGETECTLAERIDELEKSRQATLKMMTDLKDMNEQLTRMSQSAQAANQAKSEFLANMSHEIRTPMTAILGFTEMIMEAQDDEQVAADKLDAVRTIQRNAELLIKLINDILDLSKIESGKLDVETIPCSVTDMITDLKSLMSVRAEAKGIKLLHSYETSVPKLIQSDPTRLRQILVNLVGNAIKFTDTGSVKIIVRHLAPEGQTPRLEFDVVDTGMGMTAEQEACMFQPFSQADNSTTRKFGGTGLGLAICKRLAELLRGKVSLVQSVPARGSRFRLSLEVESVADVPLQEATAAIIACQELRLEPQVSLQTAVLQGMRILLAEDGEDNQRLITHVLNKAGAEVVVAGNGQLAVENALQAWQQESPFDCILMDMSMPVLDGYQATTRLREHDYKGPIIALTAHAMSNDREKCLSAGCSDFATKPIHRKQLIGQIAEAVAAEKRACSESFG